MFKEAVSHRVPSFSPGPATPPDVRILILANVSDPIRQIDGMVCRRLKPRGDPIAPADGGTARCLCDAMEEEGRKRARFDETTGRMVECLPGHIIVSLHERAGNAGLMAAMAARIRFLVHDTIGAAVQVDMRTHSGPRDQVAFILGDRFSTVPGADNPVTGSFTIARMRADGHRVPLAVEPLFVFDPLPGKPGAVTCRKVEPRITRQDDVLVFGDDPMRSPLVVPGFPPGSHVRINLEWMEGQGDGMVLLNPATVVRHSQTVTEWLFATPIRADIPGDDPDTLSIIVRRTADPAPDPAPHSPPWSAAPVDGNPMHTVLSYAGNGPDDNGALHTILENWAEPVRTTAPTLTVVKVLAPVMASLPRDFTDDEGRVPRYTMHFDTGGKLTDAGEAVATIGANAHKPGLWALYGTPPRWSQVSPPQALPLGDGRAIVIEPVPYALGDQFLGVLPLAEPERHVLEAGLTYRLGRRASGRADDGEPALCPGVLATTTLAVPKQSDTTLERLFLSKQHAIVTLVKDELHVRMNSGKKPIWHLRDGHVVATAFRQSDTLILRLGDEMIIACYWMKFEIDE